MADRSCGRPVSVAAGRVLRACLVAALPIVVSCARDKPYVKETFVMGTTASVTIYGLSEPQAETAAAEALRELHRIESVMSNWKQDSELSRLNGQAKGKRFRASRELFSVIDSSLHYSNVTDGAFDITAQPIVELWGFFGGDARMPPPDEIDRILEHVGYEKVVIDRDSSTVTLEPGMALNLAGIAKGYGVDRCVSILRGLNVTSALVNLGGNIYAIGTPPGRRGWTIGIRDPFGGTSVVGSMLLANEAVATSGNYENFVEIDGKRYGHIVDPRSGRPVEHVLSVTVAAPTALASDALSTGLFVLGTERGRRLAERLNGVSAVFATPRGGRARFTICGEHRGITGLPLR